MTMRYNLVGLGFLLLTAAWFPAAPVVADTNVTFGDCSPILNLDNINDSSLYDAIKKKYPDADLDSIEVIVKITNCGRELRSPEERRQVLIFALDRMIKLKRDYYIPALDKYLQKPSAGNFVAMTRTGKMNVRQIEDAIDKLIDYQVTVDGAKAGKSTSNAMKAGAASKNLNNSESVLRNQLTIRLQEKLTSPSDFVYRHRFDGYSRPERESIVNAMQDYRNKYVQIVGEIEKIVSKMKEEVTEPAK